MYFVVAFKKSQASFKHCRSCLQNLLILHGISRASFRRPLRLWASLRLQNPMRIPAETVSSLAREQTGQDRSGVPFPALPHSLQFLLQVHFLSLALSQKSLSIQGAKFLLSQPGEGLREGLGASEVASPQPYISPVLCVSLQVFYRSA